MARKRSPEHDYVCTVCGCPSEPPGPGARHVGGGRGMRACRQARPMLRSEWQAVLDEFARDAAAAIRGPRFGVPVARER